MVLLLTGRPTQLPGQVRVNITRLGAVRGVQCHLGGVVGASSTTHSHDVTKMVLGAPECVQKRGVVARSPTHPTTWVGAQREYAFWRTHGRPAPYG